MSREGAAYGPQVDRVVALLDGQIPDVMADAGAWVRNGCRPPDAWDKGRLAADAKDEARSWNLRWVNMAATALRLDLGKIDGDAAAGLFRLQLSNLLTIDEGTWCGPEQGSTVYGHLVRSAVHILLDTRSAEPLRPRLRKVLARFRLWHTLAGETPVGNRCREGGYELEFHSWAGATARMPPWAYRSNRQTLWARTASWREKLHVVRDPAAEVGLRLRDPVVIVRGLQGQHACMPASTSGYDHPGTQFVAAARDGAEPRYVHRAAGPMPDDAVQPWPMGGVAEIILADRDGVRYLAPREVVTSRGWTRPPVVVYRDNHGEAVTLAGGA